MKIIAVLAGTRDQYRAYVANHPAEDTRYVFVREPQDTRGLLFDDLVVTGSFNRRRHSASAVLAAVRARLVR